jgi:predicted PurR-regulated permease PerM
MAAAAAVPPPTARGGWRDASEIAFLRRVLIVLAVVALALLVWQIRGALLLVFAAVVVAVVLLSAARPIEHHLGLSRRWSLFAAGAVILLVLVGIGALIGGQVSEQVAQLRQRLPAAISAVENRFRIDLPGLSAGAATGSPDRPRAAQDTGEPAGATRHGAAAAPSSDVGQTVERVAGYVAALGQAAFDALSALVLAVVGGAFLAADPRLHRKGLVMLLPRSQHARADDVLVTAGRALRLWLAGTVLGMVIVGVLVGLGTWAIGLPAPLALALFAALTEFVPIIGPVAGSVPALLLALAQGGDAVWWTAALYIAVQQVESNMIVPMVQQRMASIPPAVLLFAVVAVGAVFGLPGVLLAAPITVVIYVAVQKLYVRQTLGEREAEVPGEKTDDDKGVDGGSGP